MPEFDVCLTLDNVQVGAEVGLMAYDGSELQSVLFTGEGLITPVSAPYMCITTAQESRFGRSKKHQIKDLSLQACSEELAAFQTWYARTSAN